LFADDDSDGAAEHEVPPALLAAIRPTATGINGATPVRGAAAPSAGTATSTPFSETSGIGARRRHLFGDSSDDGDDASDSATAAAPFASVGALHRAVAAIDEDTADVDEILSSRWKSSAAAGAGNKVR